MPECGYCKDCKWWEVGASAEWGWCNRTLEADSKADTTDDTDRLHSMDTKPDFGCVQFEVKE